MSERISDDERAYHSRLAAEVRAAQAAWTSWSVHLSTKYQLGPDDGIAEDGTITRAPGEGVTDYQHAESSPGG